MSVDSWVPLLTIVASLLLVVTSALNYASAIIHSAAFPQYPVRSVEQTIRFHLRNSPAIREFLPVFNA